MPRYDSFSVASSSLLLRALAHISLSEQFITYRPVQFLGTTSGVINFVGGWLGTGCPTATAINQALFQRGARYPGATIWLYGDGDPFYPLSHSRENFAAFQAAGGQGAFHEFPPPEPSGHYIVAYPDLWASLIETYLKCQGLPTGER